eukprot:EG_transcript_29231
MTVVSPEVPAPILAEAKPAEVRCLDCKKLFPTKQLLQDHVTKTGHKQPICKVCNAEFSCWVSLREHEGYGHDKDKRPLPPPPKFEVRRVVDEAPEPKRKSVRAKQHKPELRPRLRPVCLKCHEGFANMALLQRHQKSTLHRRHYFQCGTCKKRFEDGVGILNHIALSGHDLGGEPAEAESEEEPVKEKKPAKAGGKAAKPKPPPPAKARADPAEPR